MQIQVSHKMVVGMSASGRELKIWEPNAAVTTPDPIEYIVNDISVATVLDHLAMSLCLLVSNKWVKFTN